MLDEKLSSKQMIIDIESMARFSKTMLGKGKSYERLLIFILEDAEDPDKPLPTLKAMAAALGWTMSHLRKELETLYVDLTDSLREGEEPLRFVKTETVFHIEAFGHHQTISVDLGFIPREGEEVEIPFFKAKLQITLFHVTKVFHQFSDNKHVIMVSLKGGSHDRYLVWKRDQALGERRISLMEYFQMNDFELEKLIRSKWI